MFLLADGRDHLRHDDALALGKIRMRLADGKSRFGARRRIFARGIRRLENIDKRGADRAIEMLLNKIDNKPFASELPMEIWDKRRRRRRWRR